RTIHVTNCYYSTYNGTVVNANINSFASMLDYWNSQADTIWNANDAHSISVNPTLAWQSDVGYVPINSELYPAGYCVYGSSKGPSPACFPKSDLNKDNKVDLVDFEIFSQEWGIIPPSSD
ncbi:MAG TPA: hypothetical protein PKB02_17475, partial [Anaerohalosphaeraceae bacterium]|nr:hypothetical protein [Anaerohalosphaeraceae bacterium]